MTSDNLVSTVLRATEQDGTYPRPQLVRGAWVDLCGEWTFAFDDDDRGKRERWATARELGQRIVVPFPFESAHSGIADPRFHPVVWYQRIVTQDELLRARAGEDARILLHFGAVDYRCEVWVDGQLAGRHEGGQSPFSFDITELIGAADLSIVLRAEDDPIDLSQPRGKQDWRLNPHSIWYHRTTGIWQPVWIEAVAPVHVRQIQWQSDPVAGAASAVVSFSCRVPKDTRLTVALEFGDLALASCDVAASGTSTEITLSIARQQNGQALEELLWSPEHPTLIDATVRLIVPQQDDDVVASYLGLRSASVGGGRFLLNDRPYFVRSVLNQGYWPESHAAAPSSTALRDETRLIKDLGFNATRIHQKYEDPRFLFWADKLGLLVWEEAPSAYAFTAVAIQRTTTEWIAILDRDRSHPCIVTWVPLNESWGVPHIAQDPQMRSYARGLVNLTKAIDPTRPVISNDGWEHVESDILSIHDYDADINRLRERFASAAQILDAEFGHAGRRLIVDDAQDRHAPIMLTEFGGISYTEKTIEASWGYSTATSVENFAERLRPLFAVVNDRPVLAGYCYTQLADTGQETNGLVFEDRRPKIPLQELRRIVSGEDSLPRPGLPSQLRRDELLD